MNSLKDHKVASAALVTLLVSAALGSVIAGFMDGHVGRGLAIAALSLSGAVVEWLYMRRFVAFNAGRNWKVGDDGWIVIDGGSAATRSGGQK